MLHALSLLTRLSHLIPSSPPFALYARTARSPRALLSLDAPSLHAPSRPLVIPSFFPHFPTLSLSLPPRSLLEYALASSPPPLFPLRVALSTPFYSFHLSPFPHRRSPAPPSMSLIVLARLPPPLLPLPTLSHSPLTPSDFLRPPSRPRRVPFAPSLIYCITVHEVANLRRVILYKYVSQINIRATKICIRASRRLQGVVVVVVADGLSFLR